MKILKPGYDLLSLVAVGSDHDVYEGHRADDSTPGIGSVGAMRVEDFRELWV